MDIEKLQRCIVVFEHPYGRIEIPYSEWITSGPGKRPLLSPAYLVDSEGNKLSVKNMPFKYRNNVLCRILEKFKLFKNPWIGKE